MGRSPKEAGLPKYPKKEKTALTKKFQRFSAEK